MPLTINGYHLFQANCQVKESTESLEFTELENDLSDGYFSRILFGSENGLRKWSLILPNLPGGTLTSAKLTGINGELLSPEAYIWDLFSDTKVTGVPFAYQSPRNSQYYLVHFANKELSYQRMLTKLYSTGIELKQIRKLGATVFQPQALEQIWGSFDPVTYPASYPFPFLGDVWPNDSDNGSLDSLKHLQANGTDVVAATSGTLPIIRFSNTINDGFLFCTDPTVSVKDIFILMKMREATFSNEAGIVSGNTAGVAALVGSTGTTKFTNLGLGANYSYRKDAVSYTEANQQAPMNTWGAVHFRHATGIVLPNLQIGKDRNFAGRFAEMDVAYLIVSNSLFPKSTLREIDEFLSILKAKLV